MKASVSKGSLHDFSISLPASKSLSHRALISAGLSDRTCSLHHVADNNDIAATMQALQMWGTSFAKEGEDWIVHGCTHGRIPSDPIDCGESGSTLRFLIPLFATCKGMAEFTGHGRLLQRPQSVYADIFAKQRLHFAKKDDILYVEGPLSAGTYQVAGDVSSQFISGLLFALPLLSQDSRIIVTEPFESESYVGLTLDMLHKAGIRINRQGNTFFIPGNQCYAMPEYTVPGDDSQAAFFAALALISGKDGDILNMDHDSHQGDHVILDHMRAFGAEVTQIPNGYHIHAVNPHGAVIDLGDCPDLGPMEFAMAACVHGDSTFLHAGRLRIKESDRIACMKQEMAKLGCMLEDDGDTVYVHGGAVLDGNVEVCGHNDHRIVMALSILGACSQHPIIIEDAQAVNKSYPDFYQDLARTGAQISYDF
ncbi:MAG: 3-phosphoshikimate 1-carboxyvinyltransferase [Lactimicrobium sp.]|jgi:3-phosphoshikimate 1-carboxyvinyltransferase|uniref:3-phosphoshikimate 1-carboxyvinyltransferase n=1 Tax=Lactimicrobium sp. TaxID=2563780 RepID=UPI002F35E748